MKFSVSRVQTYLTCPKQYKYRYVDELKVYDDYSDSANALYLGTALHTGLEKNVDEAVKEYYSCYPVINDRHVEEAMKLETLIQKAKALIPDGKNEVCISSEDFIGFIDLLVDKGNGHFDIWDFKYSNNVDKYMQSFQLHVYKYMYEMIYRMKVDNLYYLFIPKTAIRQKKTEDLTQFRKRLEDTLKGLEPSVVEVPYDASKVKEFKTAIRVIKNDQCFEYNPTRLCDWCDYKDFCMNGNDLNIDWDKTRFKNLEDYKEATRE